MTTESIIFDLDGTLWDSSDSVAKAWDEALRQIDEPAVADIRITQQDLHRTMGMSMDEIAAVLFPMLPPDRQMEILGICMDHENSYIAEHGAELFKNEEKTLRYLAEKHRLFIVSNCQKGYIEAFLKYSSYSHFFTDFMCWGDTEMPKSFTIRKLMERNNCTDAVYVGDTQGDCDASSDAGIPFIHAAYGFGTISAPDRCAALLYSLEELCNIL